MLHTLLGHDNIVFIQKINLALLITFIESGFCFPTIKEVEAIRLD
jgi:hypothetical protein